MKENYESPNEKEVAQDLGGAIVEVSRDWIFDNLPELGAEVADIFGNETISTIIQSLTGGIIGGIAPSVMGIKLSYQQKRLERNVLKMIQAVIDKQDIIEQRLNQLDSEVRQKFIDGSYRDVLFDHIIAENQEQKVQENINGYINLMAVEKPNDDMVYDFFNTLSEMNQLDIRILRLYRPAFEANVGEHETIADIMSEEKIDYSQLGYIGAKLHRLGMLDSKNDERRDENLKILGDTIAELIKQMYSKKPREVKAPRLNRISSHESYSITRLGRQYLNFIDDPQ